MLRSENNPKVLAAISEVVKGNRTTDKPQENKVSEALASRYSSFKPATVKTPVALEEELSPKQKKIAKIAGKPNEIDSADLKALRSGSKVAEAKDTPGNSYQHQCAIHVKSEQFGEGRTLTSQHAEPDENGNIAWYDVMFEHGIEKKVSTDQLEILMSESHGNHKKKA